MQFGGTQRLQLEDDVTIMKLASNIDEIERTHPIGILWNGKIRRFLPWRQNGTNCEASLLRNRAKENYFIK